MADKHHPAARSLLGSVLQNRLLDVGVWIAVGLVWWALARNLPGRANKIDFSHYYCSSRLVLETPRPYAVSLRPVYERYGFEVEKGMEIESPTNPPPLLWLFVPLALLPPKAAWVIWTMCQGACLALLICLTRRLLEERFSARAWRFVYAAILASSPVYWNMYRSQVQLFIAVLLLLAYASQQKNKHIPACLFITAAGLLKVYPFVLLPWFLYVGADGWRERWRRLLWVAGFVMVAVAAIGIPTWESFVQHGLATVRDWLVNRVSNFSLPAFLMNLGLAVYDYQAPVAVEKLCWFIGAGCSVVVMLGTYRLIAAAGYDRETQFGMLTAGMLLGNMLTWGNYLVLLVFSLVAFAGRLRRGGSGKRIVCFGIAVVLMDIQCQIVSPWLDRHLFMKVLANYAPCYGMLLFMIVLHQHAANSFLMESSTSHLPESSRG